MSDETTPQAELAERLQHLVAAVDAIDAAAPDAAVAHLEATHPFEGEGVNAIRALCDRGLEEGWLCPREGGPTVKFGRIAKDMGGYAVDAVRMEEGHAIGHTHTRGEINMCFPLEGEPKFDGLDPGWVVFPPGSHHVPTVTGGTMLFIYFTPGGEVVWDKT